MKAGSAWGGVLTVGNSVRGAEERDIYLLG